jgi:hypothetical protein
LLEDGAPLHPAGARTIGRAGVARVRVPQIDEDPASVPGFLRLAQWQAAIVIPADDRPRCARHVIRIASRRAPANGCVPLRAFRRNLAAGDRWSDRAQVRFCLRTT